MSSELKLQITLKRLVKERGISLRDLAKITKVPQPTLSSYLAGAGTSKPEHIRALSKFFGCSMEFLLWGVDDRPPGLADVALQEIFDGWLKVTVHKAIPNKRKGDE